MTDKLLKIIAPDYPPMSKEQILRWLMQWGREWVDIFELQLSWVDASFPKHMQVVRYELLESRTKPDYELVEEYRLTQKALDSLLET